MNFPHLLIYQQSQQTKCLLSFHTMNACLPIHGLAQANKYLRSSVHQKKEKEKEMKTTKNKE